MNQREILSFFNISENPFSKETKLESLIDFPSLSRPTRELGLLIESRGIGILTGTSGSGKTTLIRRVASELNPGLYKTFYVSHTSVSSTEFYQSFAAELGIEPQGRRSAIFRKIRDHINFLNEQQRIHPVIFIDEAHALSYDALIELRMLTNFNYDSKNACTIILCGHPELRDKLSLNVLSSLANTITFSIRVESLPLEETATFIESRILAVGGSPSIFTQNAKKLIHDSAKGQLRLTSNIAWQSMIKAYSLSCAQVEKEHVLMAFQN